MAKKEALFIKGYLDSLDKSEVYFYKIPDNPMTGRKPADVMGWYKDGPGFLWEFKFHDSLTPFNFSNVTDLQVQNLLDAKVRGGQALVILGFKKVLTLSEQSKLGTDIRRINIVLAWDIDTFMKLRSQDKSFDIRKYIKEQYGKS